MLRNISKSVLVTGTVALLSCQAPALSPEDWAKPTDIGPVSLEPVSPEPVSAPLWASDLSQPDWIRTWEPRDSRAWGLDNVDVIPVDDGPFKHILRVRYPAGAASPSVSRQTDAPLGGAQFYGDLFLPAQPQLRLSYYVRFADGFDFVKGGKLPGLFGGVGASGGSIPDGTDGFSTRLMWRRNGAGEVYAYLPTSDTYGTSIGRGTWQFQPGIWYKLEQDLKLNTPDLADGELRLWVNDTLVLEQQTLILRTVDSLQIDGIFFSTFFGGGDPSWATPQDTYIDFANFSVSVGN